MTERNPELDRLVRMEMERRQLSRRRFLGGMGVGIGAFALAPSVLAACGDDNKTSESSGTTQATSSDTLRVSNWPAYMADGWVAEFEKASGLKVDYKEDFNDNEQWFAKYSQQLQHKQDIGADLVIPTDFMMGRLITLGWLNQVNHANVPNLANLRDDLLNAPIDAGRKYSMPYMSGMVGLGYNKKATGREITSMDDLWDESFKGQVSLLSDLRDGLGLVMLEQGNDPAEATEATVQQAADKVSEEKDKGQIRRFTGNDYLDDLAAGNLVIAQAYSGDVVQLIADNPDLSFVVPESGGTTFLDTQVIPYTTKNQTGAEQWMDYLYDRDNYAKLVASIQYVPVLSDMTDALSKIDPALASNELINPPQETLDLLHSWRTLTDEEDQQFATIYADVTGG